MNHPRESLFFKTATIFSGGFHFHRSGFGFYFERKKRENLFTIFLFLLLSLCIATGLMSIWKGIIDSLGSVFSSLTSEFESQHRNPSYGENMEGDVAGGTRVSNERVAYKLKGYYDLATEEIAKAVRAEEWGLVDDAIGHYKNAQRILVEASSTPSPSYISFSEQEKVKSYRQKITKWQGQVSERLQVLSLRSTAASVNKNTLTHAHTAAASTSTLNSKKDVGQKSSRPTRSSQLVRNQTDRATSARPTQDSGNAYEGKLVEMINSAIVDRSPSVKWDDVAGLEKAKQSLMEMVILPAKRKDLFTGLRKPARGLLLFGPPGNGKTMLAKAVASESEATFFNVSSSSLTSKWVGEGEKLVRTLFMVAISKQPSVIFIDEIDSIMSTRLASENEASRRLKSEFLIQFDGVTSNPDDLVIVIGATNKPQELDDAVLRRLVKRIYVPLPDESVRRLLFKNKLKGRAFSLPGGDLERLVRETEGYSGSDLQALCEEAAMMPIRELGSNILTVKANQVRSLRYDDLKKAMSVIRPSLSKNKWEELEQWNREFGSN